MPKVLLVDDDHDLVYLSKEVFLKQGFDVLTAHDGLEALRLLKIETPDAMVIDLTMPQMSGWQLAMKIRADQRFGKTPIIALSGLLERDADPEQSDYIDAYVVKPFDIFKLIEKIKELLGKKP